MATMFDNRRMMHLDDDDCVLMGSLNCSETGNRHEACFTPPSLPGVSSWEPLAGSSGPDPSRLRPFIGHGDAEKEYANENERKEEEKGGGFGPRFNQEARLHALRAVGRKSGSARTTEYLARTPEYLAKESRDQQPLLFSKKYRSNGGRGRGSLRYSPGFVSREGLAGFSGPDASRAQFCIAHEKAKEGEQEEEKKEEERGGGSRLSLHLGKRLEAGGPVSRKAASGRAPDDLREALSTIKRQHDVILDLADNYKRLAGFASCANNKNALLRRERDTIKRDYDVLAAKYASLVDAKSSVTATATERARQEKMYSLVGKAKMIIENARLNRAERGEHEERFSSSPMARERYPTSPVLTSLVLAEDDEMSPAARASAFLGREGTPPTGSITPTESTPAVPAAEPAACPAAFGAGAQDEAREVAGRKRRAGDRGCNSVRQPTTASSRSVRTSTRPTNQPAAGRQNTAVSSGGVGPSSRTASRHYARRQDTVASKGDVGRSTVPVNRPAARGRSSTASSGGGGWSASTANRLSARRPTATTYLGGGVSSVRPTDRPSARQTQNSRNATTSRQPLGCLKGTIASQLRSRAAVKTGGPRGMVF